VALYFQRTKRPVGGPVVGPLEIIAARVGAVEGAQAALKLTVDGLPSLWKDERERTKNHADRAAAAYRSTEEVLAAISGGGEDGGEGGELFAFDEEGGGELPALFDDVGGAEKRAREESEVRSRARRHLEAMG